MFDVDKMINNGKILIITFRSNLQLIQAVSIKLKNQYKIRNRVKNNI